MQKSMNVAWWVTRWSVLHPHKTALIFEDQAYSYGWLNRRALACARWLYDLGVEKGDRVALLLDNCPQFLELYLACARLGAIFVPLNFRLAAPEVDYLLGDCRPRVFVFKDSLADRVLPLGLNQIRPPLQVASVGGADLGRGVLDYEEQVSAFENGYRGKPPYSEPEAPDEPQVIMYTSGTTGRPKGAVLTYSKTFFNCLNANIFFKLTFDDVMLVILPLFHSGGLFIQASPCLYQGATILLHQHFDPDRAFADIQERRVTHFLGVPTLYQRFLESPQRHLFDLSSLKVCAIGGEKVTPELVEQCREAGMWPRQIMGQTETSILLWASEQEGLERPGTLGRPVFHSEVLLVDERGEPIDNGEVGEITVRGPVVMREYWHDPQATKKALRGGWLHTGDLARRDEEGYYYMIDRAKDMFISGGENVYPAEVERAICGHPGIKEAAVVGMPDPTWGECGCAYVICNDGAGLDEEALVGYLRERLAAYKVPRRFVVRREFPRTSMGKVRKFLLAQDEEERE